MAKVSNSKVNNSKTISIRVPMKTYLELLGNCQECKLSLSEYVTHKVFNNQKVTLKDKGQDKQIDKFKSEITKLKKQLKEAELKTVYFKKNIEKLKNNGVALKDANQVLKIDSIHFKNRLKKANSYLNNIYAKALSNKHNQVILTKSKHKNF